MSSEKKGFMPPNYTQTPNPVFDLMPVMSNAELRVTMVLVRETFGWHRQRTDRLSQQDIADLAGLSLSSAKTGIAEGVKRGTIRRFKTKDEKKRTTYRYGLVVTDAEKVVFEEFERPRIKPQENAAQDDSETKLPGQNLTRSDSNWVKFRPGQKLTLWPENLPGQNLTTLYKEERNFLVGKEKREEAALPTRSDPPQEVPEETGTTQFDPADAGAAHAASERPAHPVQVQNQPPPSMNNQATSSKEIPGGAARGRREPQNAEEYLRRKLSHKFVDDLLEELQPLGVDRRRDWFVLSLDRVKELADEAQRTHEAHKVKVPTRLKDLLDEECRRINTQRRPSSDAPPGSPDTSPETDPDADPLAALLAGASLNGNRSRR